MQVHFRYFAGRGRQALRRAAWLAVLGGGTLLLSGCVTANRAAVMQARSHMIGLSQADVRMCAGFPQRTSHEADNSDIWSYETTRNGNGLTVSAPILFGAASSSVSMSSAGSSCKMQVRFVDGKVTRVVYAGDNGTAEGPATVCAPIVAACASYVPDIVKPPPVAAKPENDKALSPTPATAPTTPKPVATQPVPAQSAAPKADAAKMASPAAKPTGAGTEIWPLRGASD